MSILFPTKTIKTSFPLYSLIYSSHLSIELKVLESKFFNNISFIFKIRKIDFYFLKKKTESEIILFVSS